jgi:hypothetical protein
MGGVQSMKKYENLYAGLVGKNLVGGVDLDLIDEQILYLSQLDVCTENSIIVGFISVDALRFACRGREKYKGEELEK